MNIETIWEQFGQQLKRFIASRVPNSQIAEELSQELLVKSYQSLNSLKDEERVEAWLYRIARNVINDYYRKRLKDLVTEELNIENVIDELEDANSQESVRTELSHCIQPFIEQLSEKYRQTVTAVDLEGTSQKSLAEKQGVSHSTIKSQTQRGRAQLRELFRQCCDFTIDARGNVVDYKPKSGQCNCDSSSITDCN